MCKVSDKSEMIGEIIGCFHMKLPNRDAVIIKFVILLSTLSSVVQWRFLHGVRWGKRPI